MMGKSQILSLLSFYCKLHSYSLLQQTSRTKIVLRQVTPKKKQQSFSDKHKFHPNGRSIFLLFTHNVQVNVLYIVSV